MPPHLIQQRVFQFLVHSFLYYQQGESIISDEAYDQICQELKSVLEDPAWSTIPYGSLVEPLGEEASGFFIKKYPPPIMSAALHLLYQEQYAKQMSFSHFLERQGYRFELFGGHAA